VDREIVNLLKKLVNLESFHGKEKGILKFLESYLKSAGFHVSRFPVDRYSYNILARTGTGNPVLCFNAHADTVFPSGKSKPEARVLQKRVYGLGACDNKAGLAAVITAATSFIGRKFSGTVDLLISGDEEWGARGVDSALRQGYRCSMAVVAEPTDMGIVSAQAGLLFLELASKGLAVHGSAPELGVNAVKRMNEAVSRLEKLAGKLRPHFLVGPASVNLGAIRAGEIEHLPNRVPDFCRAGVDLRFPPGQTSRKVLFSVVRELNRLEWSEDLTVKVTKQAEALTEKKNSKLVKLLQSACKKVTGKIPKISGGRGWTEASVFGSIPSIEVAVFGPGRLTEAHSSDEYVDLAPVVKSAGIYKCLAESVMEI